MITFMLEGPLSTETQQWIAIGLNDQPQMVCLNTSIVYTVVNGLV